MKRLLTMLLSFCMILSIGAHTAAAAETTLLESENGVLLSSLDDEEVEKLFVLMRRLREEGVGIIFVTHFLEQVYAVCDRIRRKINGKKI